MHFDAKQGIDSFQQSHFCDPSLLLFSVAFRSCLISSLLLDPYGENDHGGTFLLLYKPVTRELAPKLAVIFKHLVKGDSLSACWRRSDVALMPNGSPSSAFEAYKPIPITLLPSNVFEMVVAGK